MLEKTPGNRGYATALVATVVLGAILFFPLLGSFGLWDPHEKRVYTVAREVADSPGWSLPNRPGVTRTPAPVWLVTAGLRGLGTGEVAGRLPIAIASLAALLACFWIGDGLLRRRGALLGTIALATAPVFFLGARQLTTQALPILAALLATGGLALAAWPREGRSNGARVLDLALGLFGLVLGYLSSGTMIGVAAPLTAVALALVASGGPVGAWAAALLASIAAWAIAAIGWRMGMPGAGHAGGYSPLLGGMPRAAVHSVELTTVLKQIGFGLSPWVALLPSASGWAVMDGAAARERFARLLLLFSIVVGYVATTIHAASIGEVGFAGAAAVALLVGAFLDDALEENAALGTTALIVFFAAIVMGHDFFLNPERWAGAHVLEGIKWPGTFTVGTYVILGAFLAWGAAMGLAFALPARPGWFGRERFVTVGIGTALALAVATTFWIIPVVSKDLSFKGVFTKLQQFCPGAELGRYRVADDTLFALEGVKSTQLSSLTEMFTFLGRKERVCVAAAAEELAPIDQHARSQAAGTPYHVVDDSNSRVLLLSNRLGPGEEDKNPLRRLIVASLARPPQHEVKADFEGKVELLGYDLPAELQRGQKFKITLYYKVNAPLGGSYKVFLHFDGPGNRFNGDHVPLAGKFPTNHWVPGFHVIDEFEMEPDKATAPAGWYQIYTGMFLGAERLKVVSGPNDGEHRIKIGAVRVK